MDSPEKFISRRKSRSFNKAVKLSDKRKEKTKGFLIPSAIQKYEEYVTEDNINLDSVVELIKKDNFERTQMEIYIISKYLERTDLVSKLNEEKSQESNLFQLLYFCAFNINLVYLNNGKYLFREDEISHNFYIILKGSVTLLRIKQEKVTLSGFEYLEKLIQLQKKDHTNLLTRNVKSNLKVFPIKLKDFYFLNDIYFYFRYKDWLERKGTITELEEFVRTGRIGLHQELNFSSLLNKEMSKEENLHDHIDSIVNSKEEPRFDVKYYSFMEKQDKSFVILLDYLAENLLSIGQIFGDNDINNIRWKIHLNRTYTIQASEDTILGEMDENEYKDLVINEKKKNITKEVMYLIDNYYFQSVKTSLFKKKYYKHFEKCEIARGETLTREGEMVSHLYLIKEGEVEVKANQSLLELNNLLKILEELLGERVCDKGGLKSEPINHLKDLQKKKLIRLFIYGTKEAVGLIEYIFKLPILTQTTPYSDKVVYYKIPVEILNKICNDEKTCFSTMQKAACTKMKSFVSRLNEIKNHFLSSYDHLSLNKIEENKLKLKQENEELKKNNNSAFPIIKTEKYIKIDSYQKHLNNLNKGRKLSSDSRGNSIENSRVSSPSISIKKNFSVLLKPDKSSLFSEERTSQLNPKKKSACNISETKRRINYFEKAMFKNSISIEKSIPTVFPSCINNNTKIVKIPIQLINMDNCDSNQKRVFRGKLIKIKESHCEMNRSKSLNNSEISKINEEAGNKNLLVMNYQNKENEDKRPFYHQFILKSNKLRSKMNNI